MAPSLYDQFLFVVNSGDQELLMDFIKKNKDKFSETTRIAIQGSYPELLTV